MEHGHHGEVPPTPPTDTCIFLAVHRLEAASSTKSQHVAAVCDRRLETVICGDRNGILRTYHTERHPEALSFTGGRSKLPPQSMRSVTDTMMMTNKAGKMWKSRMSSRPSTSHTLSTNPSSRKQSLSSPSQAPKLDLAS